MPTRSAVLAVAEMPLGGYQLLTTVPNGVTLLVKHVAVYFAAAAPALVRVYGHDTELAVAGAFIEETLQPSSSHSYDRWVALEPGHTLRWYAGGGPAQIWISGTVLDGVSPITLPVPGPPAQVADHQVPW